jgi:Ala-tRNA(Pro) deacylase
MDLQKFLKEKKVAFERIAHAQAFSAQEVAAVEHVTGHKFAKTVIVKGGGKTHMLVLPASRHVDFKKAADLIGEDVEMASEDEMKALFPDTEIGAEPPFGSQYGMKTYADATLKGVDEIVFRAGSHDQSIKMKLAAYEKVEKPTWGSFAIEQF